MSGESSATANSATSNSSTVNQPSNSVQYCDLVMKGGITSGVVYPLAVVELAKKYLFKNIGGTSAGAIAAAITAAAEFARRSGKSAPYDPLALLPQRLGANNLLLNLFQPATATTRIFRVALSALRSQSIFGRIVRFLGAMFAEFWVLTLMGLFLGAAVPALLYWIYGGALVPYIVLGTLWLIVILLVFVVAMALRESLNATAANGFGFCSGFDPRSTSGPPLTNWLHEQIQNAAGKDLSDPLTFGDLHNAPAIENEPPMTGPTIKLQVVTTNLTLGRPFTIPFESHAFYFDPAEFRQLFPEAVVAHLERNSVHKNDTVLRRDNRNPLLRLPDADGLPVLLAARMSLSFPVLLSAIPLYYPDFAHATETETVLGEKARTILADRHWFSDGGICSNFPMHFFDSPLPRWPTFGIDLEPDDSPASTPNSQMIWFPARPGEGSQLPSNPFDCGSSLHQLAGFAGAIINTMQNWRDRLQASAAGYRERIVHVKLRSNEGGLNLNMPPKLISDLSERGQFAGKALRDEFDFATHQWARYRVTMCGTQKHIDNLANAWNKPLPQDALGHRYIAGTEQPPSYRPHSQNLRDTMLGALEELLKLSAWWHGRMKQEQSFCKDGSPQPEPILRAQPKF